MSEDIAIRVENLTKIYKLYDSPLDRLKEAINPLGCTYHRDFHALNDVSFELKKGESVGVIGKNGSGKSTLLKLLAGVLVPSSGSVAVNGKVSALLELGAGFNQELTGVENVYFNGTLMGYTRDDMDARLDSILSFADIGEFAYQPVKLYSSGMFVRLAFAVAVNVEPDILIIDEALAVGDLRFQKKCKEKMNEFKDRDVSLILVSHSMADITTGCDTALYLKDGTLAYYGNSSEAATIYYKQENYTAVEQSAKQSTDKNGTGDILVHNIYCYQLDKHKELPEVVYGKNIQIEIEYEASTPIYRPLLRLNLSVLGYRYFVNFDYKLAEYGYESLTGQGYIHVELINPNIYPGSYTVNVSIKSENVNTHLFYWNDACVFTILSPNDKFMHDANSIIHLDSRVVV